MKTSTTRTSPATSTRATLVVLAALVAALVGPATLALGQTPYDVEDEPATGPVVPPTGPVPTTPLPDVREEPVEPVADPDGGEAVATVDGVPTTIERRDGDDAFAADDPILVALEDVSVLEDGSGLLLPLGPGGSAVPVRREDLRITAVGGAVIIVVAQQEDGTSRPQDAAAPLQAPVEGDFRLVLAGFAPGTIARIVVYSDPVVLGEFPVGDDGTVTVTATLPADLPVGPHVLQIDAVREDGAVIRIAEPIEVVADAAPDAPVEEPDEPADEPEPAPDVVEAPDDEAADTTLLQLVAAALVALIVLILFGRRRGRDADADGAAADDATGKAGGA